MTTSRSFYRNVENNDGYILEYPNARDSDQFLQSYKPNPFVSTKDQIFELSTLLKRGEEKWRYCYAGSVQLELGVPTQMMDPTNADSEDNLAVGTGSAIGDTTVFVDSTSNIDEAPYSTVNGLRGGFIYWNTAAGQGQCRKIKDNTAFYTGTEATIELYDLLTIAVTTDSKAGIIPSVWWGSIAITQLAAFCNGVPEIVVPTTARWYWSKVRGPIALIQNATIAIGTTVVVGTTAAKVDPGAASDTELVIGIPLTPAVTTDAEHFMCELTLE